MLNFTCAATTTATSTHLSEESSHGQKLVHSGYIQWRLIKAQSSKIVIIILWKKSGDQQLRLVVFPIIYKALYIPGGFSRRISEPSTVWWVFSSEPGLDGRPRAIGSNSKLPTFNDQILAVGWKNYYPPVIQTAGISPCEKYQNTFDIYLTFMESWRRFSRQFMYSFVFLPGVTIW